LTIVLEKLSVDVLETLPPRPRCLQEQANDLGDAMANNMNLGAEEPAEEPTDDLGELVVKNDIKPGTRVKATFGVISYEGFIRTVITPFDRYEIVFDDGDINNMRINEFSLSFE